MLGKMKGTLSLVVIAFTINFGTPLYTKRSTCKLFIYSFIFLSIYVLPPARPSVYPTPAQNDRSISDDLIEACSVYCIIFIKLLRGSQGRFTFC